MKYVLFFAWFSIAYCNCAVPESFHLEKCKIDTKKATMFQLCERENAYLCTDDTGRQLYSGCIYDDGITDVVYCAEYCS